MNQSTSLYLGPPRDRRRGKRVLTRQNVFFTFVALMVVFAALSLWGESGGGDVAAMNRLFGQRVEPVELRGPSEVVEEHGSSSETYADPLLVSHGRRSALLGVHRSPMDLTAVSEEGYEIRELTPAPRLGVDLDSPLAGRAGQDSRFVISGSSEGVELQVKPEVD